jgi:hypothetical protein
MCLISSYWMSTGEPERSCTVLAATFLDHRAAGFLPTANRVAPDSQATDPSLARATVIDVSPNLRPKRARILDDK